LMDRLRLRLNPHSDCRATGGRSPSSARQTRRVLVNVRSAAINYFNGTVLVGAPFALFRLIVLLPDEMILPPLKICRPTVL
jgi:hypothetical protein